METQLLLNRRTQAADLITKRSFAARYAKLGDCSLQRVRVVQAKPLCSTLGKDFVGAMGIVIRQHSFGELSSLPSSEKHLSTISK